MTNKVTVNGVVLSFNVDTAMAPAQFSDGPEVASGVDRFEEYYDRRNLEILGNGRAARPSILR